MDNFFKRRRKEKEEYTKVTFRDKYKKGHSGAGKAVRIVLSVLLLLFLVCAIFIYAKLKEIKRVSDDIPRVSPDSETFDNEGNTGSDTIDPDEITWDKPDGVIYDKDIRNILLIGQDARPGESRARSDAMIICSINTKTKKITLCSIMRDLYVPIEGYSDNRINAAYQYGGMELLDDTIEKCLGIPIDGNVEVNFEGFINVMSKIGNIDIELNQDEVNYFAQTNPDWGLKVGVNALTPEQALAYARLRHVGKSDWERTDRQRRVLMAAFEKVRAGGLTEVLSIANQSLPYLTTDMTDTKILSYVAKVITGGMTIGEQYRCPFEGTYTEQTLRKGMEVLVPDLAANAKQIQTDLYGRTIVENTESTSSDTVSAGQ
ncbi:MAG: LCP family protein [Eubacteriales bacterium]|jgi:LCP family protein required for cell wall assembly